MTNGSVSILSLAHLGLPNDLKSHETMMMARSLVHTDLLHQLFVIDAEQTEAVEGLPVVTPVPGNKFIPRVGYLLEGVLPRSGRDLTIDLLDRFTAGALGGAESVLHTFAMVSTGDRDSQG